MIDIPVTIQPIKPKLKSRDELNITLSDAAASRIIELREERPLVSTKWLRVEIKSGGCAGYQYSFFHDQDYSDGLHEDDYVIHRGTAAVVIDAMSANLIEGATIDYVNDLTSSQFVINIPNSTKCGCGVSFQI